MTPRVMILGAGGFLGGHLAALAGDAFRARVEITSVASVRRALEQSKPDAVVLAAAISDIDECERNPTRAHQVNVAGAANVARECARTGARLLFTSSAAVFDGDAPEYAEDAPPNPRSVYGITKAEAEGIIAAECPGAIIVRFSLLVGAALLAGTNSLIDKLRGQFESGQAVAAPSDEYRNAIDVETAARWILDLAAAPDAQGVFHLGSADAMSRFEMVRWLATAWGYSEDLVTGSNGVTPHRAPRGRRHMLRPARIAEFSTIPVPTCLQALERCSHVIA
jgi:dTDP-4-dehydrorhamnose reductase